MDLAIGTLVGILIGATCAGPLKVFLAALEEQHKGASYYVWLGAILAYLSAALGWLGFTVVVTTFVLYQLVKAGGVRFWSGTTQSLAPPVIDSPPVNIADPARPRKSRVNRSSRPVPDDAPIPLDTPTDPEAA